MIDCDVANFELADNGLGKILWADRQMQVLSIVRDSFLNNKPLSGQNIACCLHVTAETANLMRTLKAGGANIKLCASNPLSTQDDVAAALVKHNNISVYAIHGEDNNTYYQHIRSVLDFKPTITIDDGADLINTIHQEMPELIPNIICGMEETTTGVIRLKAMAADRVLKYPVIAVNDAKTKHLFDNFYGTGQSTIDGILRATNILLAGKVFVVIGYGQCGKGVAKRASGMGARVIISEVNPIAALQAALDGFEVLSMGKAASIGDIFVTVTGNISVIDISHIQNMKDGAIMCNAGHFNVEINLKKISDLGIIEEKIIRENLIEYTLESGKKIIVISEGRLVNLAAAEGHPAAVMDMSFANQALCAEYFSKNPIRDIGVYPVPKHLDELVAELKLTTMGINIDISTPEQKKYLESWEIGT